MKIFSVIVIVLFLNACSILDPAKFDYNQYSAIVDIRQLSTRSEMCGSRDAQRMLASALQSRVDWVSKYTEYLPRNKNANVMFTLLDRELIAFSNFVSEGASETFCKEQLLEIQQQSIEIQHVLGMLPR